MNFFSKEKKVFTFSIVLLSVFFWFFILNNYLFFNKFSNQDKFLKQQRQQNYISGVVNHHLIAESIIEKFFIELAKDVFIQKIILIGPDHFNIAAVYGNKIITVNTSTTDLRKVSVDNQLLDTLTRMNDFAFSDYAIKNDHGIMNILPFIKSYFPEAKIIPFLIPLRFSFDDAKNLAEKLNKILPDNSFVLASVDWSHYLPKNVADFHDAKSIRVFLNFEEQNFSNIEVDCPQCLYVSRYFAKLRNANDYIEIDHKNSQDFLNNRILDITTSYYSAIFSRQKINHEIKDYPKTVLFLGNINLDSKFKRLIDKNGLLYPIKNIRNFLRGIDIVVANLEGSIISDNVFKSNISVEPNFDFEVLDLLSYAKINLISLINDHIVDKNKNIFFQTRELLNKRQINYFGDPTNCREEDVYQNGRIIIIGLNVSFSINCSKEQIITLIKNIRDRNNNGFIIILVHWGKEYEKANNVNLRKLAHLMIDNGADLVIGLDSYFVGEIERYKNKLIFYSLGSFISDQYFSQKDQESLAVGLEIFNNRVIIRLFPLGIKEGQPYLLDNERRIKFLKILSLKSLTVIKDEIADEIIIDN